MQPIRGMINLLVALSGIVALALFVSAFGFIWLLVYAAVIFLFALIVIGISSGRGSVVPPGIIDHIGIAVADLDAAAATYGELLGAQLAGRELLPEQGVEVAFLELPGETRIELVSPVDDDGPVATFLQKRGDGMHHVCVRVDDIEAALASLADSGAPLLDEMPRDGAEGSRIAFVHPRALGGVLLELKQKP